MNEENYVLETKEMPKKWIPDHSKFQINVLISLSIAVLFFGLCYLILGKYALFVPVIFIFILPFILIFNQTSQKILSGAFIYDEGLYMVMMDNLNRAGAYALAAIGADGLAASHMIQGKRNDEAYLNRIVGIKDILKLADKPTIWKFIQIKNVTQLDKNRYKIEAQYSDLNKGKIKNIKFTLRRNRYNNFEELVKVFEQCKNNV